MTNPPNNVIFQYVRNRRRQKVGVVAAVRREDDTVGFGYSLCAKNKGDEFNSTKAIEIAVGRALNFPFFKGEVPHSVLEDWQIIYDRAVRYFKDCTIDSSM